MELDLQIWSDPLGFPPNRGSSPPGVLLGGVSLLGAQRLAGILGPAGGDDYLILAARLNVNGLSIGQSCMISRERHAFTRNEQESGGRERSSQIRVETHLKGTRCIFRASK